MSAKRQKKIPAHESTHEKYDAIAKERGWSLTTAAERIVNDFIQRHGVAGAFMSPRPPRRKREPQPAGT